MQIRLIDVSASRCTATARTHRIARHVSACLLSPLRSTRPSHPSHTPHPPSGYLRPRGDRRGHAPTSPRPAQAPTSIIISNHNVSTSRCTATARTHRLARHLACLLSPPRSTRPSHPSHTPHPPSGYLRTRGDRRGHAPTSPRPAHAPTSIIISNHNVSTSQQRAHTGLQDT
jgi:hypothetical protein